MVWLGTGLATSTGGFEGRASRGLPSRRTRELRDQRLYRQADALHGLIDADHFHLNHVADFHRLPRILDVLVRQLGDMYETVLVNAEIHECSEIRDVRDTAFELHAF